MQPLKHIKIKITKSFTVGGRTFNKGGIIKAEKVNDRSYWSTNGIHPIKLDNGCIEETTD